MIGETENANCFDPEPAPQSTLPPNLTLLLTDEPIEKCDVFIHFCLFVFSYSDATSPSSGSSLFFKLIHAQTGRALTDNGASLAQEGVFDGDELIMVRERLPTLTTLQVSL